MIATWTMYNGGNYPRHVKEGSGKSQSRRSSIHPGSEKGRQNRDCKAAWQRARGVIACRFNAGRPARVATAAAATKTQTQTAIQTAVRTATRTQF